MKITYTDSGKSELEQFKQKQVQVLEDLVTQQKYVFGDDSVEVTGSDVRSAAIKIRPIGISGGKSTFSLALTAKIYLALGLILTLGALGYPYLHSMLAQDRMQFLLFTSGITVGSLGYIMQLVLRMRARSLAFSEVDSRKDVPGIPPNEIIQFGELRIKFQNSNYVSGVIRFPRPFPTIPQVLVTEGGAGSWLIVKVDERSTIDFKYAANNMLGASNYETSVQWMAISKASDTNVTSRQDIPNASRG